MSEPRPTATTPYDQHPAMVRFDWGLAGALSLAPAVDVVVIVDVLSFTTTVSVAADHGIAVLAYPWRDAGAAAFARARGAALAVERSAARAGEVSLAPGSIRRAAPRPPRVVLPSPNGSTIAHAVDSLGLDCVAACFRNAGAVAGWIAQRGPTAVGIVAAGERWPDGSLRPAAEDLWGAGAVIDALARVGLVDRSAEAGSARAAYLDVRDRLSPALADCASGREAGERGRAEDVLIAAEADHSAAVPVLVDGAFAPTA